MSFDQNYNPVYDPSNDNALIAQNLAAAGDKKKRQIEEDQKKAKEDLEKHQKALKEQASSNSNQTPMQSQNMGGDINSAKPEAVTKAPLAPTALTGIGKGIYKSGSSFSDNPTAMGSQKVNTSKAPVPEGTVIREDATRRIEGGGVVAGSASNRADYLDQFNRPGMQSMAFDSSGAFKSMDIAPNTPPSLPQYKGEFGYHQPFSANATVQEAQNMQGFKGSASDIPQVTNPIAANTSRAVLGQPEGWKPTSGVINENKPFVSQNLTPTMAQSTPPPMAQSTPPPMDTNNVVKMNRGGIVRGRGTATSDSIPAMLSNGEMVLPANVVNKYGQGNFEKMIASTPEVKGAKTSIEDGVIHAAAGVEIDTPISRIPAVIPMNEHPGTRVIPTTLPPPMQGGVIDQAVSPTPVNTPIVSDMSNPAKTDINNTPKPAVAPAVAPTVAPTPSITDTVKGVAGNAMDAVKNKAVDMYNNDSQGNPESPLEATTRRAGMAGGIIKSAVQTPSNILFGEKGTANIEKAIGTGAGELGTKIGEAAQGLKSSQRAKAEQRIGAAQRFGEGIGSGYGLMGGIKGALATPATEAKINQPVPIVADKAPADLERIGGPEAPEATATQSVQPYRGTGKPVSTLDVTTPTGGTGKVQFADGRKLSDASMQNIQGVMKREADPAFKARLAEENARVEKRMAEGRASNAPAQQQVQQVQQQQAPDYSGDIEELMSQMPSGSSTDSLGTMIANKSKRAGILARVGALQNAQKMAGERASEANKLAAEQARAQTAAQTEQTRLGEARQDRLAGRELEERKFTQGQQNIEATREATAAERAATHGYQQATLQQKEEIAANTPRTYTIGGEKVNVTPAEVPALQREYEISQYKHPKGRGWFQPQDEYEAEIADAAKAQNVKEHPDYYNKLNHDADMINLLNSDATKEVKDSALEAYKQRYGTSFR